MAITDLRLGPYLLEIGLSCDLALGQLAVLEASASAWSAARVRAEGAPAGDSSATAETVTHQNRAFEALEAFLALWARASFLVYPSVRKGQEDSLKARRGADLRRLLGVPNGHALDNRDLRDAWVHFDERIDQIMESGDLRSLQRFTVSRDVTDELKRGTPRLIEMDTLRIHFHDRDGTVGTADLHDLQIALTDVLARTEAAWGPFLDDC